MAERTSSRRVSVSLKHVLLIILLALLAGSIAPALLDGNRDDGTSSFSDSLFLFACYLPAGFLLVFASVAAVGGVYYGKQRMDARARIWRAKAETEEALAARQQARANDMTPGPGDRELARLTKDEDGKLLLIAPELVSSPVTVVDPESGTHPNHTSEELRAMALVSNALRAGGGGSAPRAAGGEVPSLLLLKALGMGGQQLGDRSSPIIEVMDEDDVKVLQAGRE